MSIETIRKKQFLQGALCRLLQLHSPKNEKEFMEALEEYIDTKIGDSQYER